MAGNTAAKVYELAKPIADSLGFTIWDVNFEKEGAFWFLRVLIDKENGSVSMDDCEKMTRPLSAALDETDPIEQSYTLEVGSPGLERLLRREEHFMKYTGQLIRVRYIRESDGVKEEVVTLKAFEKGAITVMGENGEKTVKLSETASVRVYEEL